jgi:hypothetical protein
MTHWYNSVWFGLFLVTLGVISFFVFWKLAVYFACAPYKEKDLVWVEKIEYLYKENVITSVKINGPIYKDCLINRNEGLITEKVYFSDGTSKIIKGISK